MPKKVKKIEYREERKVETIPKEVTVTDYYAVEYLRQYIPQYFPEKRIEYIQVPKKQVRYEYIPVERQIVHYPDQPLEIERTAGYQTQAQTVYTTQTQPIHTAYTAIQGAYQAGGQGGQTVYQTAQGGQTVYQTAAQGGQTVYQTVQGGSKVATGGQTVVTNTQYVPASEKVSGGYVNGGNVVYSSGPAQTYAYESSGLHGGYVVDQGGHTQWTEVPYGFTTSDNYEYSGYPK